MNDAPVIATGRNNKTGTAAINTDQFYKGKIYPNKFIQIHNAIYQQAARRCSLSFFG